MANNGVETPRHPTISDYGFTRQSCSGGLPYMQFMDPYIDPSRNGSPPSWTTFDVYNGEEVFNSYAVSPSSDAYITGSISLTEGEEIGDKRLTPMRHRDLMVDNYLASGGDLKAWRYIGTQGIVNDVTRDIICSSFQAMGKDFTQPGSVEFVPGDCQFTNLVFNNPFTRGIQGLLREYEQEMGKAKIKKVIFISAIRRNRKILPSSYPLLHLVVELCRPGDHGYPNN